MIPHVTGGVDVERVGAKGGSVFSALQWTLDTDMMAYFSHEQPLSMSISAYSDLNPTPLPFRFH